MSSTTVFKVGDIFMTNFSESRKQTFVSKAINKFMNIYRKNIGLPKMKLYSHAGLIIELWGQLYTVEALSNGVNVRPFNVAYPDKKRKDMLFRTPKKLYTKAEQEKLNKAAMKYVMHPTRYGYADLLYHARAILSKKGYSIWQDRGTKEKKRMHCTELVATLSNDVRPNTFDREWSTNPVDIMINKYYKDYKQE